MEQLPSLLIDRVSARVRGRIPEGLETHLIHQLSGAELSPSNLTPGAILLVNHLALGTGTDWAVAARGDLATLVDRAVIPDHGIIPTGAEAVRFQDWSELLACLAMDLASNRARDRWWWRSILKRLPRWRGGPTGAALAWDPRVTPLLLSHLQGWGVARSVLRGLPAAEIEEILGAVLRTWGAPALGIALPRTRWIDLAVSDAGRRAPVPRSGAEAPSPPSPIAAMENAPLMEGRPPHRGGRRASPENLPLPPMAPPATPWSDLLAPEQAALLTPAEEALLGTALLLVRSPHRVRSTGFTRAVVAWAQAGASHRSSLLHGGPPPSRPSVPAPTSIDGSESRPADHVTRASVEVRAGLARGDDRPEGPLAMGEGVGAPPVGAGPPVEQAAALAPSDAIEQAEGQRPADGPEPAPPPVVIGGLQTQYGGLFYLINLFQYLELPDRFEEEWGLASRLSAWGLLWAVGLSLLDGAAGPDPIWALLSDLDGGEPGELLGAGLGPKPVATPTEWGRTETGFADPTEIPGPFHPDLRRFLAGLMPGLTARLQGALPPDASIQEILTATAEVTLAGPHLDLRFPLEAISIPARMAGLDRNPGWTAAFGRIVTFTYV